MTFIIVSIAIILFVGIGQWLLGRDDAVGEEMERIEERMKLHDDIK